jgi:AcrR family transcriptional regulator
MRDSQRTVAVILEAAERVIVQSGVEKATIDEVAREAGISKGGVLHHFPSKEAIIIGLVSMMVSKFEAEVLELQAQDSDPNGSFTRAFLHKVTEADAHCIEVFFALQAAFRSCPALQQLKRDYSLRWQARVETDGIDPVCATVVRLATDGLWLAKNYKVAIPSEQYQKPLLEYLIALTRTPVQKRTAPARRTRELATR